MDTTIENQVNESIATPKKSRFIFRNLTEKQKKSLTTSGIGLAGMMAGAGAFSLFAFSSSATEGEADVVPTTTPVIDGSSTIQEPITIYTDAPFADSVTDDMTFNEAFAAARKELGQGGFFEWNGNTYNTYYKEEWEALSPDQQDSFMASVHNSTDYKSIETGDSAVAANTESMEEAVIDITDEVNVEVAEPITAIHATPVSAGQEDFIVEDMPAGTPDQIQLDYNNDGVIDAVAIDSDGDGYVDVIAIDNDYNGEPDTYLIDTDGNDGLDTLIIDDMQDGIQGDELVTPLSEESVINMDEMRETLHGNISQNTGMDGDIPEDLPDLDNDADISDFA